MREQAGRIQVTVVEGGCEVELVGEIDASLRDQASESMVDVLASRGTVVVDASQVTFIDSTGLGVLVGALKRVRTNDGDLALVCTGPRVLKVFEITGLTKVFAIHGSVDEALAG